MIINVLLPTLFPGLADRALDSLFRDVVAQSSNVIPVIVGRGGWDHPAWKRWSEMGAIFVDETHSRGVNAALRLGIQHCSGDMVLVASDDVVFSPGWLCALLEQHDRIGRVIGYRPFAIGLRYGPVEQIGTCYGRMYPTFPFFNRGVLDNPEIRRHFFGDYLHGQWGDVAFGMAIWDAAGAVFDSHSEALVRWHPDRLGYPHARPNREMFDEDMRAFRKEWKPVFGDGWHQHGDVNEFNVNCPPAMLRADTICIPHAATFKNTLHRCLP